MYVDVEYWGFVMVCLGLIMCCCLLVVVIFVIVCV